jgi:hypothetical protein
MNPKIEITSLSFSKLKNEHSFSKYNIEASIDEAENRDSEVVLKYKLVFLSNPTNTKISVEGLATLYGDQAEISAQLGPDEKNIPMILNSIYQEIFPLFFIVSKSMQIPCPAYRLSQMTAPSQPDKIVSEQVQETSDTNAIKSLDIESGLEEQIDMVSPTRKEQVIEQQM